MGIQLGVSMRLVSAHQARSGSTRHPTHQGLPRLVCLVCNTCNGSADRDGLVQDAPPLGDELAQDPALAALKLVAWAADDTLLPRAGERGFPHWGRWAERNKRFTRDVVQWFAQGAQ